MYIFSMKPSRSWSSLHYTTTLDFCKHIFELKEPLERNMMVGQPSTTHYMGFWNVYIWFEGLWQLLKLTLHHYMGLLNAYTQIETVSWKMLTCLLSLHYTTTLVIGMYISHLKPSSSWSSLHYTTTLDFCTHIFKLKGPLERNLSVGQPYTTPLHGFFECIYLV